MEEQKDRHAETTTNLHPSQSSSSGSSSLASSSSGSSSVSLEEGGRSEITPKLESTITNILTCWPPPNQTTQPPSTQPSPPLPRQNCFFLVGRGHGGAVVCWILGRERVDPNERRREIVGCVSVGSKTEDLGCSIKRTLDRKIQIWLTPTPWRHY